MNWKRALIPLVVVVPLIVVLAMGFGTNPREVPFTLKNQPAPDFSLMALDGSTVSLKSLRGKPVVINFWASWCQPCKVEHQWLQQGYRQWGERVHFLGIVYQDERPKVEDYLSRRGNLFPHLLDDDSEVAIAFGVSGVPESFFIDKNGVIRHKQVGVVTPEILQSQLVALGGES